MDVKAVDLPAEYDRRFGAWLVSEVRALRARFVIATGTVPTRLFVPVEIEPDLLNGCPPGLSSVGVSSIGGNGALYIAGMEVIPATNLHEMKVAA